METEKKRKRGENGEASCGGGSGGGRRKKEREVGGETAAAPLPPPPKEEEVEEFFAILRNMHVAVKYFEKNSVDGNGRKLTGRRWGTALETELLRDIDGVKVEEKRGDGGIVEGNGGVLDLNAIPEAETNSV